MADRTPPRRRRTDDPSSPSKTIKEPGLRKRQDEWATQVQAARWPVDANFVHPPSVWTVYQGKAQKDYKLSVFELLTLPYEVREHDEPGEGEEPRPDYYNAMKLYDRKDLLGLARMKAEALQRATFQAEGWIYDTTTAQAVRRVGIQRRRANWYVVFAVCSREELNRSQRDTLILNAPVTP
ncbi:hypothetical protein MKEN_00046000 [Mycena kentingensis (nom. inval.)]|nr:hypothetical protein MKEN_00046000 [Mycena kentingensis (nom. inval.)]